jgi:NAD(P)H dehydrogenase (quinone)
VESAATPWIDNLPWRNKVAGGFTHSQAMSGDKLHSLPHFTILAAQHGMIWVPLDQRRVGQS